MNNYFFYFHSNTNFFPFLPRGHRSLSYCSHNTRFGTRIYLQNSKSKIQNKSLFYKFTNTQPNTIDRSKRERDKWRRGIDRIWFKFSMKQDSRPALAPQALTHPLAILARQLRRGRKTIPSFCMAASMVRWSCQWDAELGADAARTAAAITHPEDRAWRKHPASRSILTVVDVLWSVFLLLKFCEEQRRGIGIETVWQRTKIREEPECRWMGIRKDIKEQNKLHGKKNRLGLNDPPPIPQPDIHSMLKKRKRSLWSASVLSSPEKKKSTSNLFLHQTALHEYSVILIFLPLVT